MEFFNRFLNTMPSKQIQVVFSGGKTGLNATLGLIKNDKYFKTIGIAKLGIVQDADNRPAIRLAAIQADLTANGLPSPSSCGVWTPSIQNGPQTSCYLLPDPNTPGEREDLILGALQGDPAMPCIDAYFQCISAGTGSSPNNLSKSKVVAYLASKDDVDTRVGIAAQHHVWDFSHNVYNNLRNWLQSF